MVNPDTLLVLDLTTKSTIPSTSTLMPVLGMPRKRRVVLVSPKLRPQSSLVPSPLPLTWKTDNPKTPVKQTRELLIPLSTLPTMESDIIILFGISSLLNKHIGTYKNNTTTYKILFIIFLKYELIKDWKYFWLIYIILLLPLSPFIFIYSLVIILFLAFSYLIYKWIFRWRYIRFYISNFIKNKKLSLFTWHVNLGFGFINRLIRALAIINNSKKHLKIWKSSLTTSRFTITSW